MSKTKTLVSVIIPTFNSDSYIADAVRSVLSQTYTDLEVLVIDDGSTDSTREVVGEILDERLRYIPMEKRCGNYFARNKGIAMAQGEYIAFLDADDLWANDKLRKQMTAFEERPEIGICFSDHLVFEDQDKNSFFKDLINTYPFDGKDYGRFIRRLLSGNFIITSSVLAKRECFDSLGQFDTGFQNAMDYDMWLRIVLNYKPHFISEGLIFRRLHKHNISRNKVNSMKAVGYVLGKLLSEGAKHKFYSPQFEPLIRKHQETALYYLGLEYLEARDFENGKKCLEACRIPGKAIFLFIALLAAKTRCEPILQLMHHYRKIRTENQLKPIKTEKNSLCKDGDTRKEDALRLSVIIATLNRPDDLRMALESVYTQTHFPDEILIIDQSSERHTEQLIHDFQAKHPEKASKLIYVHQQEKSLVKARNRGLELAVGDVISFLDDDIELQSDYYKLVLGYLEAHPEVGALSGNTILETPVTAGVKDVFRKILKRIFLVSNSNGRMTVSGFGYPIIDYEIVRERDVEMLPGCNMNFRKSAIQKERFDEWFTGYSYREDAEFSYRISKRARTVMIPNAKLYHHYATANRLETEALKTMQFRNYLHVFQKHKERGWISSWFFLYSLSGILLIDLLEFFMGFRREKWVKLHVGIRSALAISRGQEKKRK